MLLQEFLNIFVKIYQSLLMFLATGSMHVKRLINKPDNVKGK